MNLTTELHDSIQEERTLIGTAEIEFQCPACGNTNQVDALRFKATDKLLGLFTLWVTHETAAKCPDCNATFRSANSLEQLAELSTEETSSRFRLRIGLVEKFLVIAGWILLCSGPVSLVLFLVAMFMVPPAVKSWKRAAVIGVVASSILTLIGLMGIIFAD